MIIKGLPCQIKITKLPNITTKSTNTPQESKITGSSRKRTQKIAKQSKKSTNIRTHLDLPPKKSSKLHQIRSSAQVLSPFQPTSQIQRRSCRRADGPRNVSWADRSRGPWLQDLWWAWRVLEVETRDSTKIPIDSTKIILLGKEGVTLVYPYYPLPIGCLIG